VTVERPELDVRLASEYRASRERMLEIATSLDETAAHRRVPACPAWTVRDLMSHVAGIASDLSTGRRPEGETQAWVDRQVAERSTRTLTEIASEWDEAGPAFEAMIEERPRRYWGLTYDTVVHEHDLRNAVGRPGARDSAGVEVAAELGLRLVALDLAKHGLPAFRAVIDGRERVVGDGQPELTLEASAFEALRLLGSRRTLEQVRAARFTGDLDRYLGGLFHMDLPTADLGE
jgi:uncharacterized protein (TIGR03083 family)